MSRTSIGFTQADQLHWASIACRIRGNCAKVLHLVVGELLEGLPSFDLLPLEAADLDNESDLMMSAHFEKVRLNSDY